MIRRRAGTVTGRDRARRAIRFGLAALLAAAGVTASTACTDQGDDVQTMAPDQATARVKQYAETVRGTVGLDAFSQANENVTPCEGRLGELSNPDEVYYVQGVYQLMVPAERQAEILSRAREQWQRDGLTIKKERSFGADGTGEIGVSAADGYALTLTSGEPPAMLLLVSSPCYRR